MQDQHIKEFGIPQGYTDQSIVRANHAIAKAKYAVTQDGTDKMDLRLAKADLDALKAQGKPVSNYKTKSTIEVALNIQRIDPRHTTVIEYYNMLEQAQEVSKDGGRN